IGHGEPLILRRVVFKGGETGSYSKAYLNDAPISVRLLNQIGDMLVEIHGQFENHGLMNPQTHQTILDAFAGSEKEIQETKTSFQNWKKAQRERIQLEEDLQKAQEDYDYLSHTVKELEEMNPQPQEEEILAEKRKLLMSAEKNIGTLREAYEALTSQNKITDSLKRAQDSLLCAGDDSLAPLVDEISKAWDSVSDVSDRIYQIMQNFENPQVELEATEERLFALRGLARKHRCLVSELSEIYEKMKQKCDTIENSDEILKAKKAEEDQAKKVYADCAKALYEKRKKASQQIEDAVHKELVPLRLESARFEVALERLPEELWRESGNHTTIFQVAMNPGASPSPIHKTASGGELARLMLALKVVLAQLNPVPVMVFDEIDTGISGATSSAVGERLKRLGETVQVLVVTHSPQVASNGHQHLFIQKESDRETTTTTVFGLSDVQREREVARLLSGDEITESALKAARELLQGN
ncbi:MAG: DNA repair protein RecN, partial [Alphaproteobacteria bacterium]|nr:DNA repair protein RecN [Alphaproteobacteria bacterium]